MRRSTPLYIAALALVAAPLLFRAFEVPQSSFQAQVTTGSSSAAAQQLPKLTILLDGVDASDVASPGMKEVTLMNFTATSNNGTHLRTLRAKITGASLASGFIVQNVRLMKQQGNDWVQVAVDDGARVGLTNGFLLNFGPIDVSLDPQSPTHFRLIGDMGDQVGKSISVQFPLDEVKYKGVFVLADGVGGVRLNNGDCWDSRGVTQPAANCSVSVFGYGAARAFVMSANVGVNMRSTQTSVLYGKQFPFEINVANAGLGDAQTVVLTFAATGGSNVKSVTLGNVAGFSCNAQNDGSYSCAIPTLALNQTKKLTVVAVASTDGNTPCVNDSLTINATVSAANPDPVPTDNVATLTVPVQCPSADLSAKTTLPTQVTWTEGMHVTVEYANAGPQAVEGATLLVEPDMGTQQFQFFTDANYAGCSPTMKNDKKVYQCQNLALQPGSKRTLGFTLVPLSGTPCTLNATLTAATTITASVQDPNAANNVSAGEAKVSRCPAGQAASSSSSAPGGTGGGGGSSSAGGNNAELFSITKPDNNAYVTGEVELIARAATNPLPPRAKLFLDADYTNVLATAVLEPNAGAALYRFKPNSRITTDGYHTFYVRFYDSAGTVLGVKTVGVIVMNMPPNVLFSPNIPSYTQLVGTVNVGLIAGNPGATATTPFSKEELLFDGTVISTLTSATSPFTFPPLDTTKYSNASHTIEARAYNAAGVMGSTTARTVTVNNPPKTPCPLLNNEYFVRKVLYSDLLAREPDAGGLAYWIKAMNAGTTRNAAVDAVLRSDEFLKGAFGTRAYRLLLANSGITPYQLQQFLSLTRAGNLDQTSMVNAVLQLPGSPSFGGTTDAQFVTALYRNVLQREPDAAGLQAWLVQLRAVGRVEAARQFVTSAAADALYARADWVRNVYLTLLQRIADPNGEAVWVAELSKPGATTQNVLIFLLNEPEFLKRYNCDGPL